MRRLVISAWVVIVSAVALAQGGGGILTGVVTGPTGAPVPNAPVQAKNRQGGAIVRAVTTADGRYRLAPLPAGSYDISISMPCCAFEPFARQDIADVMRERRTEFALEFDRLSDRGRRIADQVATTGQASQYRRLTQLGLQPIYRSDAKNPLPWMDQMLNAIEHTNFFENRATEYSKASTKGTWEEAFG